MPDEFPTLEVVAALGMLALLLRALIVTSEIRALPQFASRISRLLEAGNRSAALVECNAPGAPALARTARHLIQAAGEPPYSPESITESKHEQAELEQDLARRAESGRARDLIVLSVLLSAMAFAVLSKLPVSRWFHALAVLASALLVLGYVMRSRLRGVERAEFGRIGETLSRVLAAPPMPNTPTARPSLHSIDGGCAACGETLFLVARDAALGASLPALGIHELRICKHCGFVVGQAQDSTVLGLAALEELSVPYELENEASSDDTEHDG